MNLIRKHIVFLLLVALVYTGVNGSVHYHLCIKANDVSVFNCPEINYKNISPALLNQQKQLSCHEQICCNILNQNTERSKTKTQSNHEDSHEDGCCELINKDIPVNYQIENSQENSNSKVSLNSQENFHQKANTKCCIDKEITISSPELIIKNAQRTITEWLHFFVLYVFGTNIFFDKPIHNSYILGKSIPLSPLIQAAYRHIISFLW